MKNKDLIAILENLSPTAEVNVAVKDIATGNHLADTYDIGFAVTEDKELKLQVAVEVLYRDNHTSDFPLSLAELKRMQGEPVWVRDQGGKGIPICGIVHNNCIAFASGSVVWLDENAGDVKCGSWWFAYRYKPQGN